MNAGPEATSPGVRGSADERTAAGPEAATSPAARAGPDLRPWQVQFLGRTWSRASPLERAFWGGAALVCAAVLAIALWLTPDPRGIGTHEQLGLPACGFVVMFGMPCPSCGFTTTFTLAAHGQVGRAFVNQPFGFVLFLLTVAALPLTGGAALRGASLLEVTDRWPWWRIVTAFLGAWLLGWLYKCKLAP